MEENLYRNRKVPPGCNAETLTFFYKYIRKRKELDTSLYSNKDVDFLPFIGKKAFIAEGASGKKYYAFLVSREKDNDNNDNCTYVPCIAKESNRIYKDRKPVYKMEVCRVYDFLKDVLANDLAKRITNDRELEFKRLLYGKETQEYKDGIRFLRLNAENICSCNAEINEKNRIKIFKTKEFGTLTEGKGYMEKYNNFIEKVMKAAIYPENKKTREALKFFKLYCFLKFNELPMIFHKYKLNGNDNPTLIENIEINRDKIIIEKTCPKASEKFLGECECMKEGHRVEETIYKKELLEPKDYIKLILEADDIKRYKYETYDEEKRQFIYDISSVFDLDLFDNKGYMPNPRNKHSMPLYFETPFEQSWDSFLMKSSRRRKAKYSLLRYLQDKLKETETADRDIEEFKNQVVTEIGVLLKKNKELSKVASCIVPFLKKYCDLQIETECFYFTIDSANAYELVAYSSREGIATMIQLSCYESRELGLGECDCVNHDTYTIKEGFFADREILKPVLDMIIKKPSREKPLLTTEDIRILKNKINSLDVEDEYIVPVMDILDETEEKLMEIGRIESERSERSEKEEKQGFLSRFFGR